MRREGRAQTLPRMRLLGGRRGVKDVCTAHASTRLPHHSQLVLDGIPFSVYIFKIPLQKFANNLGQEEQNKHFYCVLMQPQLNPGNNGEALSLFIDWDRGSLRQSEASGVSTLPAAAMLPQSRLPQRIYEATYLPQGTADSPSQPATCSTCWPPRSLLGSV